MKLVKKILQGKSGVYKIFNIRTQEHYIGSSRDLYKRISSHFSQLEIDSHSNKKMQASYNAFGNFGYRILEECSAENLVSREQHYMNLNYPDFNSAKKATQGRPKEEAKTKITVSKDRQEFLKILANFSDSTFDKVKKAVLEALK